MYKRQNRKRAKGWKIYQSYVPTRKDSILFPRISKVSEQDSLPKQDTLRIKKDSACLLYTSGVLKYGIPEFRLPNKIVDVEIDNLSKMGVKSVSYTHLDVYKRQLCPTGRGEGSKEPK